MNINVSLYTFYIYMDMDGYEWMDGYRWMGTEMNNHA